MDRIWSAMDRILPFWTIFCPFTPPPPPPLTTRKIKILKKQKKIPGDIIILHMHNININDNHMMYGS